MTIDQDHGKIYIFGGSCLTQTQELNDFYVYDIQTQKWELLHNSRISQSTNKSTKKINQKDLKMINRKFTSQLSFKVKSQPSTPLRRLSDNKYQKDKFFEQPQIENVIHEAVKQNMMFFKCPNSSSQRNSNIIINQGTPIPLISPMSIQESENDIMTVKNLQIPLNDKAINNQEVISANHNSNEIIDFTYSPGEALFRQQQNLMKITKIRRKNLKSQIKYEDNISEIYTQYQSLRDKNMSFRNTSDFQNSQTKLNSTSKKSQSQDINEQKLSGRCQRASKEPQNQNAFDVINFNVMDEKYNLIYHKKAFNLHYANFINTYFQSTKNVRNYQQIVKTSMERSIQESDKFESPNPRSGSPFKFNFNQSANQAQLQFQVMTPQNNQSQEVSDFEKSYNLSDQNESKNILPHISQNLIDHINHVDTQKYYTRQKIQQEYLTKRLKKLEGHKELMKKRDEDEDKLKFSQNQILSETPSPEKLQEQVGNKFSFNLSTSKLQQPQRGNSRLSTTTQTLTNFFKNKKKSEQQMSTLERMTPISRQLKESVICNLQSYCDVKAITREQSLIRFNNQSQAQAAQNNQNFSQFSQNPYLKMESRVTQNRDKSDNINNTFTQNQNIQKPNLNVSSFANSLQNQTSGGLSSPKQGQIQCRYPTHRDGMSIVIIEQVIDEVLGITNKAVVLFGGDRFKMAYNDLYCFTI